MDNDFKDEVIKEFSQEDYDTFYIYIEKMLEDDECISEIINGWNCSLSIEKNDALNHTYHFDFDREKNKYEDDTVSVSFYTGIQVGCEMVDYSLEGNSLVNQSKVISIFSHIEINWSKYLFHFNLTEKSELSEIQIKKIENIFNQNKEEIESIIQKQSYDDHVNGGGTFSTNSHYKNAFNKFENRNVFWNVVYKDQVVDRNII